MLVDLQIQQVKVHGNGSGEGKSPWFAARMCRGGGLGVWLPALGTSSSWGCPVCVSSAHGTTEWNHLGWKNVQNRVQPTSDQTPPYQPNQSSECQSSSGSKQPLPTPDHPFHAEILPEFPPAESCQDLWTSSACSLNLQTEAEIQGMLS